MEAVSCNMTQVAPGMHTAYGASEHFWVAQGLRPALNSALTCARRLQESLTHLHSLGQPVVTLALNSTVRPSEWHGLQCSAV